MKHMDYKPMYCVHTIKRVYGGGHGVQAGLPDGRWVRAVPEPFCGGNLQAAWEVLCGRAFAFRWPQHGELEDALSTLEEE